MNKIPRLFVEENTQPSTTFLLSNKNNFTAKVVDEQ
jgi:hypothetical protein